MIKVKIEREQEKLKKIIITGHSGYDDYGKDIVCSSVSSIVITTVNGIIEINPNYLTVTEEKDKMEIMIKEQDEICIKLINNMISLLGELSKSYPKNITIK